MSTKDSVDTFPARYLYQVGTYHTLANGQYNSHITLEALLRHGNYGFGTLPNADGEMVILNGAAWHINTEKEMTPLTLDCTLPYALVGQFFPQRMRSLRQINARDTYKKFTRLIPNEAKFSMALIRGTFSYVRVSIQPVITDRRLHFYSQERQHVEYEKRHITGDMVLLFTPMAYHGLHPTGTMAYFHSERAHIQGKVIDFKIETATLTMDVFDGVTLTTPYGDALYS